MKEEDGIPGQREMERRSMKQKFVTWMGGMPLSFVKGNMRTVNYFFSEIHHLFIGSKHKHFKKKAKVWSILSKYQP